jgi:hypothetical protein
MTLRKSWLVAAASAPQGANALDGRLAQAGSYVRSAAGLVRAGVLGYRTGIVATRPDMVLDVGAFEAVLTRGAGYGVTPIANDGVIPVALPASPSSNSRWVRVYALQRDNVDAADADNNPVLAVVAGNAAASPSLPALPLGAMPIARILQPANVLGTADCDVTEDFPMTATAGGVLPARTKTELDAFSGAEGQLAVSFDTMRLWERRGGVWRRNGEVSSHSEFQFDRAAITDGVIDLFSRSRIDDATNDEAFVTMAATSGNTLTLAEPGIYDISYQVAIVAATTGAAFAEINTPGQTLARDTVSAPDNVLSAAINGFVVVTPNTTISFRVRKTTGGTANITGRIRVTRTGSFA